MKSAEAHRRRPATASDAAVAGAIAAILSGVPSTIYALAHGRDPLEGALAAGTLLLPRERRHALLLPAATIVHLTLSFGWALVLARTLPERHVPTSATVAGLAIAALDLGLVGRRFPAIRSLPAAPQIADHLAYAWTVAAVLHRRRRPRLNARVDREIVCRVAMILYRNPGCDWKAG